MAEENDTYTGQWGTVSFAIPDYLEGVRDAVNDFADLLITALEIANVALEFAKAFVKGFLDPIAALLDAIIEELMAIIRDLREIGLYITGDWALLGWPPEDLRGGFASYERRMIARLSDRSDPTRPDISSKTKVLGFFGYHSVDASEIERLINFILSMIKMFGLSYWPDTSRLPIPVIKTTSYGLEAVGGDTAFQFTGLKNALREGGGTPPSQCRVTWVTQPASQKHPLNPFSVVGPSGYLVTVSTMPEGLQLRYSRPKKDTDKKDADGKKGDQVQPREYGSVLDLDGQPIVLHGGAEMLDFLGSDFEFNSNIDTSKSAPEDGTCQVFGMLDPSSNEIVPLEELGKADGLGEPGDGKGSEFLLQRTFLIQSDVALAQWFAGEYSTVLSLDDMPHEVVWETTNGQVTMKSSRPASTYYVRAWSAGKEIADAEKVPQWDFKHPKLADPNVFMSGQPFFIGMKSGTAALGMPSQPRKITFAGAHTQDYLHAIETALFILVLTRADLTLLDEIDQKSGDIAEGYKTGKYAGEQFALKATGLEDSRPLLTRLYPDPDKLSDAGQGPQKWRTTLFQNIRQLALDIYEHTGPLPGAEKAVVDATEMLRTLSWETLLAADFGGAGSHFNDAVQEVGWEWVDEPLLILIDPEKPLAAMSDYGVVPNILSAGIDATVADELFIYDDDPMDAPIRHREDHFAMWDGGGLELTYELKKAKDVAALKRTASPSALIIYDKFTDQDGKLLVPTKWRVYLEEVKKRAEGRHTSSGDMTPMFVAGAFDLAAKGKRVQDWTGMLNLRGLLLDYDNGTLMQQAALALRIGTAAYTRAPQDGEWIALRLFDTFPELETFLNTLENWVKGIALATQSMADAIVRYIEFLQAQIVEAQQLIRRINALIQSFLAFSFTLPQFSGLMLLSDGTDGLMSDLVTAKNKPSDSPRAYGGGVALVVPFGPSFMFDLIALAGGEEPDPDAMTAVTGAPDAIGIEQIEPGAGPAPTDEPDVL
jgi:hypothetical protein